MDINNVSTFITLDPSKLFNAEGLYQRAMVMYEGDEDLIESFLKEHLASDSLAYAMHLLEETSSTSYMGVKIHYNGTSFSAPTAGVYGVKSRPEIKARIKAKVLKRNDQQNKAAALKKEEVEIVDEGKGKKEPRWQDDDCDGKWYEKGDTDGKISKREKKAKAKNYKEEVEVSNVPENGCTTRKDQLVNIGEEGYDRMRDDRLVKYGIGYGSSDRKPSKPVPKSKVKGKTVLQRETEKKYGKGKSALDIVKQKITDKYGKGAIMSKESVEEAVAPPAKEDSKVKRQNMLKRQVLMKKLQAVRAGGGADVVASYQPEGELVTDEYTVTNADKKGNTKAWQNYKAGKKNVKTGKPLYKAADHVKEDSDLDTKFSEVVSENSSLEPQAKAIDVADKNNSVKGKKKGNVLINPEVKTNVDESMETQKDNLQEVDLNTRSVDYGQEIKNAEPIKKKKPLKDFKKLAGAAAKNKKLG